MENLKERRSLWKKENPETNPLKSKSYPLGWKNLELLKPDARTKDIQHFYEKMDDHMKMIAKDCNDLTVGMFEEIWMKFHKIYMEDMGMIPIMLEFMFPDNFPKPLRFHHSLMRYTN